MKDQIIHISFAKIDFQCPYCGKEYLDINDKYLYRCNKNKCGYTKIKCDCTNIFGMCYDITGQAIGFKLIDPEYLVNKIIDKTKK